MFSDIIVEIAKRRYESATVDAGIPATPWDDLPKKDRDRFIRRIRDQQRARDHKVVCPVSAMTTSEFEAWEKSATLGKISVDI